jgi:hypothetical protein
VVSKNRTIQNRPKNVSAQTSATSNRGLKVPGPEITDLIRAANLFPKEGAPNLVQLALGIPHASVSSSPSASPSRSASAAILWEEEEFSKALEEAIERLPEDLRIYLFEKCKDVPRKKIGACISFQLEWARKAHETLTNIVPQIQNDDIKHLRVCPLCGKIFYAVRKNQHYWPEACAQKARDEKWRRGYAEKHGHTYKAPSREPRFIAKVRRILEDRYQGSFRSTAENKKELAAYANVTLKECEEALKNIAAHKKKRAKTARKR